jgi:RNA polymerase sigma-70 factor (ECF subfamily)
MLPTDDAAAIRLCQQGDSRGLTALMQHYQVQAVRVAFLLLGDRALAEDVAQESFVQAWHAIGRFRPGEPFAPWLMRIVANTARSHHRSLSRHPALSLEQLPPDEREALVTGATGDPVLHAEQQEIREALLKALDALTPVQREALVLRYYLGYDAPEIAQIAGCKPDAARRRIHDGLAALERVIGQRYRWLIPASEA